MSCTHLSSSGFIYNVVNNYYAHLNITGTGAENNIGTRVPINRDLILPMSQELEPLLEYWGISTHGSPPRDSPVSPPCSPRGEADDDDDEDYEAFTPYIIIRGISFDLLGWREYPYPKKGYSKIVKQKNIGKRMRRHGMLKQPGGSSCNQRR